MPAGIMNFPILSPEQANPLGSAFLQALTQSIAARHNLANTKAQEAKNPYVGLQANQDLQNSMATNLLTRSQAQELQSQAQLNKLRLKYPALMNVEGAAYSGIGANGNSSGMPGNQNASPQMPQQNMGMGNPNQQEPQDQQQSQSNMPMQQPGDELPADIRDTVYGPKISSYYNGPNAAQNAVMSAKFLTPDQKANIELQTQQQKNLQEYGNKKSQEISERINTDNNQMLYANKFLHHYDQANDFQKGAMGGRISSLSHASQELDNDAANMAVNFTKNYQNGTHITDATQHLASTVKLDRKLNAESAVNIAHGIKAQADRDKTDANMFNYMVNTKHMSPVFADKVINKMQSDIPYFNTETNLPNDYVKHVWPEYLTPKALDSIARNQDYTPEGVKHFKSLSFTPDDIDKLKQHNITTRDIVSSAEKQGVSTFRVKEELKRKGYL